MTIHKFYRTPNGKVAAFLNDGSQDDFIPEGLVSITEAEADALINPPIPNDELAKRLLLEIDAIFQQRMDQVTSKYPPHERETWRIQLAEAKAFDLDENAITPWLDINSNARGITVEELANKILGKAIVYSDYSADMIAHRHKHKIALRDILQSGKTNEEIKSDLEAYNVTINWG